MRNAKLAGSVPPTVANTFMVKTCQQKTIKFMNLSTWEMIKLNVETMLEIPTRLKVQYNITTDFLTNIMPKYSIQMVGKQPIKHQYQIVPPNATESSTRHYSWPKAAGEHQMRFKIDIQSRSEISRLSWASAMEISFMFLSTTMPMMTC